MSKLVAIIQGHNFLLQGAMAYNGKTEFEYTMAQAIRVVRGGIGAIRIAGMGMVPLTTDGRKSLNNLVKKLNYLKPDYGIDLHFNFNAPRASGTEVIVSRSTTEENKIRAGGMCAEISAYLGLRHRRRVASRDWIYPNETPYGTLAILDQTTMPMIILETCFLNEHDLGHYHGKEWGVADIIRDWMFFKQI